MEFGWLTLLPPLLAIALALVTREVYSSLLIGVLAGSFILNDYNLLKSFEASLTLMFEKAGDPEWNTPILFFLAILGAIVALITASGGAKAYGNWAIRGIRSREGAQLSTFALGIFIFIDDYFNSLTVGTVMKPVTDRFKISRAKLAYILDSTAAPVCILAPISSWVVYVISIIGDQYTAANYDAKAFTSFISTIPYNYYAWLALLMVIIISTTKLEFGPMARLEKRAIETGELQGESDLPVPGDDFALAKSSDKGSPWDLILPILSLIVFTVISMLYTGGFFKGENTSVMKAFGDTNAAISLVYGGFLTLLVAFLLYLPRKIMSFSEFMAAIIEGVKSMVPSFVILILAWSLGGVTKNLGTGEFVASLLKDSIPIGIIPGLLFLISGLIAFSTGTSWGTFAIMLPIAIPLSLASNPELLTLMIASVLAGGVFGDHCSPISDTTILSSAGASCHHMDHVATQWPYAVVVALAAMVGYFFAGWTGMFVGGLIVSIVVLLAMLWLIYQVTKERTI